MRVRTIPVSWFDKCPIRSLQPSHYDDDGTCKCAKPSLFDGSGDLEGSKKDKRLARQLVRVFEALCESGWITLHDLAEKAKAPEASVSARIRDLRKPRFGGFTIEVKLVVTPYGQWHEYRLILFSGNSGLVYNPQDAPRSSKAEARKKLRAWLDGQYLNPSEVRALVGELV